MVDTLVQLASRTQAPSGFYVRYNTGSVQAHALEGLAFLGIVTRFRLLRLDSLAYDRGVALALVVICFDTIVCLDERRGRWGFRLGCHYRGSCKGV